jgi:uncharacterized membrane protein
MNDHTDGPKRLIDRPTGPAPRTTTGSQPRPVAPDGPRSAASGRTVPPVSLALVVAGVLTQIAYPLLSGSALRAATIVSVLLLAAAAVTHAGATRGRSAALIVPAVAGGLGLAAETIGVHTGFPFGTYSYADSLGPHLFDVPLVVPLAWTMLAYPCLLLGRRLTRSGNRVRIALAGGVGLAGWDLFLDPQMVAQGHWSWADPTPALPGVPGVPLTNYAGWLLVSVLLITVLDRTLPPLSADLAETGTRHRGFVQDRGEIVPAAVLAWTWCGSAVGNLVFFDRPWVALYGGLAMGAVVLPYLMLLRAAVRARSSVGTRSSISTVSSFEGSVSTRTTSQLSPTTRTEDTT